MFADGYTRSSSAHGNMWGKCDSGSHLPVQTHQSNFTTCSTVSRLDFDSNGNADIMIIMMIIVIIMIVACKGAVRDFFTISSLRVTVSSMYAQEAWVQSCANHMQHIARLPHATCHATYHAVRRDSPAIMFVRVEIDIKLLFDISTKVISLDCFSYCVLQIISPQSEGKKIVVCLSSAVSKNLVTMFISAESLVGLEDVVCYLVSKTAHRLRSIQNGNPQSPIFIGPQTS